MLCKCATAVLGEDKVDHFIISQKPVVLSFVLAYSISYSILIVFKVFFFFLNMVNPNRQYTWKTLLCSCTKIVINHITNELIIVTIIFSHGRTYVYANTQVRTIGRCNYWVFSYSTVQYSYKAYLKRPLKN